MDGSRRSWDVLSLGEALVDFLPSRRGPLEEVPSFERHPGGAPANVAIGVARLGGRCAFVGAVGADPFGAFVAAALLAEGVDTRHVRRAPEARTGLAFVSLDEAGQPRFYSPGGAPAELSLTPQHVAAAPYAQTRVVHFSSALLRAPSARAATFAYVEHARAASCVVAFDPNLRLHHWADPAPLAHDVGLLVGRCDVVKLSNAEIAFTTGTTLPLDAARRLVGAGPRLAVVTCGPDGCVWARRRGQEVETGAVAARATTVVDTTGAGDGFQAALVAGLARVAARGGDPLALDRAQLERLLARCCEVGTRVCEKVGAVAGLPRASELDPQDG